jgi:RNA-directed DNA polymerase
MTDSTKTGPYRATASRRRAIDPALSEDLMERVLASETLRKAWHQVKANHSAPGVDGMTIAEFPAFAREQWASIRAALQDETYQPAPVRRAEIPKGHGPGKRWLGIPTVVDRIIQQAIAQVLGPLFDPEFSGSSFGCRPGRSAHQAVKQIQGSSKAGYRVAVDLDLAKVFDRVNHDALMARVARKVRDKALLRLIGKYLRAGILVGESLQPSEEGVPQGSPLSPLLSNSMLDDLDKELEQRGHRFTRDCDDFLIVVKSKRAGGRLKARLTRFLQRHLKLEITETKSTVGLTNACTFLGFTFHGTRIYWSPEAFQDFRYRLRQLTGRSWGVSMPYRIHKLNEYIRGWMQYFGPSQYYRPLPELDAWLRRRLRMGFWKQWRYVRTKVRELLKLGTAKQTAVLTALSRKGPWHLSRTLATQTGMTTQWLTETLGLVSIRALWISLHYPTRTAECGPACPVVWGGRSAMSALTRLGVYMLIMRVNAWRCRNKTVTTTTSVMSETDQPA